jgi:Phytanoyl-CoA dioxygenase (PhyH)
VALDPATRANGCVEVIPGSHRLGLLSPFGSTISEADTAHHCSAERARPLEVEAGHAVLMHNWLIHRSGVNPSPTPRRAFTACYMDGRTRNVLNGKPFPLVLGSPIAEPYPFEQQLRDDAAALRDTLGLVTRDRDDLVVERRELVAELVRGRSTFTWRVHDRVLGWPRFRAVYRRFRGLPTDPAES